MALGDEGFRQEEVAGLEEGLDRLAVGVGGSEVADPASRTARPNGGDVFRHPGNVEASRRVFLGADEGETSRKGANGSGGGGPNGAPTGGDAGFRLLASVRLIRGFNPRTFEQAMIRAWKLLRPMVMSVIGTNLFQFWFEYRIDINLVLREGPWRFNGHPVAIKEIPEGMEAVSEPLTLVPYWVQMHGIPQIGRKEEFARFIGDQIGQVLETDVVVRRQPGMQTNFFRVRIAIDTAFRLPRGTVVPIGQIDHGIAFKYERLFNFCFACGMVDHVVTDCDAVLQLGQIENYPYGSWLRGSPPRQEELVPQFAGGNPFAVHQAPAPPRYVIPPMPNLPLQPPRPRPALVGIDQPKLALTAQDPSNQLQIGDISEARQKWFKAQRNNKENKENVRGSGISNKKRALNGGEEMEVQEQSPPAQGE